MHPLLRRLINYNRFKEHEVKALWMWLQVSGAKLATIGTLVRTAALELQMKTK